MNTWTDSEGYARQAAKVDSRGEALMLAFMWPERDGWTIIAQHPLDIYRIDLAVPEAKVAVEVNSLGAHGSAAAMAHDARRRTVLARLGWETVELPSQEVFTKGYIMLAERVLPAIAERLPKAWRPSKPRAESHTGTPDADFAKHSRNLLATLHDGPPDPMRPLKLSPTHEALADRTALELLGIDLLLIVLDQPPLLAEEPIVEALRLVGGPVALGLTALRSATRNGIVNVHAFLGECPAILHPLAVRRLAEPVYETLDDARAAAAGPVAKIGGSA